MLDTLSGKITELSTNKSLTVKEILALSTTLADQFSEDSDLVSLEGNTLSYYINFFGVLFSDSRLILLDPHSTPFEIDNVCKYLKNYRLLKKMPEVKPHLSARSLASLQNDDRPRLMFMSSGTTSAPKGILHSFKNISEKIRMLRDHLTREDTFRTLAILPVSFCYGLNSGSLVTLSWGGEVFLADPANIGMLSSFGQIIDEKEITYTTTTPTIWQLVLRISPKPKKNTLKKILIAAAPLSQKLYEAVKEWAGPQCEVMNVYGLTESCEVVSGPKNGENFIEGYIGEPWAAEMKIEEGELCLKTPALFKGYEIEGVFTPEPEARWFRTGDCAEKYKDGYILKGRIKTMINKGGFKIYPEDLEIIALKHKKVDDCCAFAMKDFNYGEIPALAVVVKDGESLSDKEIHEFMLQHMNHLKCPGKYFFTDKIPRTTRGKFDRKELMLRYSE